MSIRTVVTRGYGAFGTITDVTRRGYGAAGVIPPDPPVVSVFGGHFAKKKLREKPRDDTEADLERAWRALTETTEAVEEVVASPAKDIPPFEAKESRLTEAMAVVGRLLESVERIERAERSRLQAAVAAAREAQRRLDARIAAEERMRAEMEAKHQAKLKRFKAAALIAMHLLED